MANYMLIVTASQENGCVFVYVYQSVDVATFLLHIVPVSYTHLTLPTILLV